ncbi:hypothetical protein [Rothia nasimurium]|uniref:hypothetical protein n=1 Tax=Rothia nasimurium TaxID=85336 RepID=UPI001F35F6E2|nr:hypothetical protein [Rothia nasimurium]
MNLDKEISLKQADVFMETCRVDLARHAKLREEINRGHALISHLENEVSQLKARGASLMRIDELERQTLNTRQHVYNLEGEAEGLTNRAELALFKAQQALDEARNI